MLKQRVFGDRPVPEWALDHEKFLAWAQCRVGNPAFMGRVDEKNNPHKRIDGDAGHALVKEINSKWQDVFYGDVLGWEDSSPDHMSFGWGGVRVSFKRLSCGRVELGVSDWGWRGWTECDSEERSGLINLVCAICTSRDSSQLSEMTDQDPFYSANTNPFHAAGWDRDRFVEVGEYVLSLEEGTLVSTSIQGWPKDHHVPAFVSWVKQCMRKAAFRFPELRWVWMVARLNYTKGGIFPVDYLLLSLSNDPIWMKHPFAWLCFTQCQIKFNPFLTFSDYNFRHTYPYCNEDFTLTFDEGLSNIENFIVSFYSHKEWSKRVTLLQAYRIMENQKTTSTNSILASIFRILARENQPVPSLKRLHTLSSNKEAMMAFLGDVPEWANGEKPWPFVSYLWDHPRTDTTKHCKKVITGLKKEHLRHPVSFMARGRAAHALVKAPLRRDNMTVDQTHAADREALSQLGSTTLAPYIEWERLPQKAPWSAYLTLLKHARRRALEQTPDMQLASTSGSTPVLEDDAPWESALGLFSIGDIRVFPLCRPSHLATMGEFFQNCMSPERSHSAFVERGREYSERYFRLEQNECQALLSISYNRDEDNPAWKIAQLLGRFNQLPTPEFQAAATRIVDVYTSLVPTPPICKALTEGTLGHHLLGDHDDDEEDGDDLDDDFEEDDDLG